MTTGSVPPTCGTCRHFAGPECRRFPPTVVAGGQGWPRVAHDAWCGEHEERVEEAAKPVGFAQPRTAAEITSGRPPPDRTALPVKRRRLGR